MTTKKPAQSVKTKKPVAKAEAPAKPPVMGLQIVAMQLENIKRVGFVRIRPKGNLVEVVGANGSGKTTVLDGIDWALTGMGSVTSEPIRQGAERGEIQLVVGPMNEGSRGLATLNIRRTFVRVDPLSNAKGEKWLSQLTVSSADARYNSPQKVLDELLRRISFDPLAFLRMAPKEQLETLSKLSGLNEKLAALEIAKQAAYDARRELKRDAEKAETVFAGMQTPAEGLPAEPVDMGELQARWVKAEQHNAEVARKQAAKHEQELISRNLDEVAARIKREIAEMQAEHDATLRRAQAAREKAKAMEVPEVIDAAQLREDFAAASATNQAIDQRKRWEAEKARAEAARAAAEAKDAEVKRLEKERSDTLSQAKMPLPELAIGDGEVLYKTLPLTQASNAEQIRVSAALAMASSPTLRVMCIRDGSLLDAHSMEMLDAMCQQEQYQLWIERVQSDGPAAVVMVDGEASGPDVEAAK